MSETFTALGDTYPRAVILLIRIGVAIPDNAATERNGMASYIGREIPTEQLNTMANGSSAQRMIRV